MTVAVCLAVLAAGCSVGPSTRPPVAVRGDAMPAPAAPGPEPSAPGTLPPADPLNASIPFFDCTSDTAPVAVPAGRTLRFDCGELTVPADPADPSLGTVSLQVLRAGLADAPENRPPLVVVGDSGGDGSARAAAVLAGQVPDELLASYTLVGVDRRGAGNDRLDCAPVDARAALVDADPDGTSVAELTDLLEQARAVVQECTLTLDDTLGTFRSAGTAADLERLRIALGVAHLSAIGVGDGAGALATWAAARPGSVGRLVLDGPPAPGLDEPERAEARAAAAESAFDAFAVSCTARPGCPLGAGPRTATAAVIRALHERPLATPDGRRLTAGSALLAVRSALGEPGSWPALATAVAAAGSGDAVPMLALLDPVTGPRGRFDATLATACNDARRRLAPGEISALAQRWRGTYPLFGASYALDLLDCAPWPTGGADPAQPGSGLPPVLVLGTAADARNPLEGSRRAAESLPAARFVSWLGAGAGAYPRTPCVSAAVDTVFRDGTLPRADLVCPP